MVRSRSRTREPTRHPRSGYVLAFAAAIAIVVAMDSLAGSALAADPAKTLRVVLTSAEQSFDPQFTADGGSDATSTGRCWGTNVDVDPAQRPK